jgi:glycosyltransferase involved in cell wall biosynthesis
MTKVLLVASHPDSILTFRGQLIEALLAHGCEVHVAAPDLSASLIARIALEAQGVHLHDIPLRRTGTNPVADLRLVLALFLLMRRVRPFITLPYTVKPVVYGTLAAWLARVPQRYALITGLGYAFTGERKGVMRRIVGLLYRIALERTHKVFFQNPDDEYDFRVAGILPSAIPSVIVNGSGIDVASFSPKCIDLARPVFLMIARLLGDKGVREYVAAAQRVKTTYPAAQFRLVGWIDTNPDAISQSELDSWVAGGAIEFLGKLDDVRPAISGASIYVLPSYREGTPRTVLEAMAMGRPVITTDAPGCRETVRNGDNGFLVPVRSVDALVDAMLRFIEEPALAIRMGARSRQIAEERYDVHKVNAVMLREMGIEAAA